MVEILGMLTSNLATKLIRVAKTSLEIKLLGVKHEDYQAAFSFLGLAREMFINGLFNNLIIKYYVEHGIIFIRWFLTCYSFVITGIILLICLFSNYLFYIFHLTHNLQHGFAFYLKGLSPLFILFLFNETFKAVLYGNKKLILVSLSIPISNIASLICLLGALILPKSVMLLASQLIYTIIQITWNFYYCKETFNRSNSNNNILTQEIKNKFHADMIYNMIIALVIWGSFMFKSSILTKKQGDLSLTKYSYAVINTIIDLLASPIVKYLYTRHVRKSSDVLVNKTIIHVNTIGLVLGSITYYFAQPITNILSKNIPELYPVVRLLSITILPNILYKFCKTILMHQKRSYYNLIITITSNLLEVFFILISILYTQYNKLHIVLYANIISLIFTIAFSMCLLYKDINKISYITLGLSYLITCAYIYSTQFISNNIISTIGLLLFNIIIIGINFLHHRHINHND